MDKHKQVSWVVIACLSAPLLGAAGIEAAAASNTETLVVAQKTVPVPPQQNSAVASDPSKPVPDYQRYVYHGDRFRDPFIPLVGERREQGSDLPPQITSLLLKGIIQDGKSRMALLTSGVSSYILRGGRLYDGRNHLMKGVSGIVKPQSVVLMGSDRTVRELKVTETL